MAPPAMRAPTKASAGKKNAEVTVMLKAALKSNFLFRHLADGPLAEIVGYMEKQAAKAGDYIITQGDDGSYFYVCAKGEFDVLVNSKKVFTYIVNPDEGHFPTFGELALMYAKPRAASIVATKDGMVWRLGRGGFRMAQQLSTGTTDITKLLRRVPLLTSLSLEKQAQLAAKFQELSFEPSEYIYAQGDLVQFSAPTFFIVLFGSAAVYTREAPGSPEIEEAVLQEGDFFGEQGLLTKNNREASVKSVSKVQVGYISRNHFESVVGPLDALLVEERSKKEAAIATQTKRLEELGMTNANQSSFLVQAQISEIPCGALFLTEHKDTHHVLTLRQELKFNVVDTAQESRVQRELEILHNMNNIEPRCAVLPDLLHAFHTDMSLFLLIQQRFCCDLASITQNGPLPKESLVFAGSCIAEGLKVLHDDMQIIYRNLVPESIHIVESGYVVLSDHRFSKHDQGNCRTLCGAPQYFAPEMVRAELQSFATDWWAFGVLLFELSHGEGPWGGEPDDMMLFKSIMAHTFGNIKFPDSIQEPLRGLTDRLLHDDPAQRIGSKSSENVLKHEWFSSVDWDVLRKGAATSPLQESAKQQLDSLKSETGDDGELLVGEAYEVTGVSSAWLSGFADPTGIDLNESMYAARRLSLNRQASMASI